MRDSVAICIPGASTLVHHKAYVLLVVANGPRECKCKERGEKRKEKSIHLVTALHAGCVGIEFANGITTKHWPGDKVMNVLTFCLPPVASLCRQHTASIVDD